MKDLIGITITILLLLVLNASAQPHFSVDVEALSLPALDERENISKLHLPEEVNSINQEYFGSNKINQFTTQSAEHELKKPNTALRRALTHTSIPVATAYGLLVITNPNIFSNDGAGVFLFSSLLFFYGTTIGPSVGNLYARDINRGIGGIAVRALSWYFILSSDRSETMNDIGLIGLIGSSLYNIATGPVSARQYNRSVNARISPSFNPESKSMALTFRLQF